MFLNRDDLKLSYSTETSTIMTGDVDEAVPLSDGDVPLSDGDVDEAVRCSPVIVQPVRLGEDGRKEYYIVGGHNTFIAFVQSRQHGKVLCSLLPEISTAAAFTEELHFRTTAMWRGLTMRTHASSYSTVIETLQFMKVAMRLYDLTHMTPTIARLLEAEGFENGPAVPGTTTLRSLRERDFRYAFSLDKLSKPCKELIHIFDKHVSICASFVLVYPFSLIIWGFLRIHLLGRGTPYLLVTLLHSWRVSLSGCRSGVYYTFTSVLSTQEKGEYVALVEITVTMCCISERKPFRVSEVATQMLFFKPFAGPMTVGSTTYRSFIFLHLFTFMTMHITVKSNARVVSAALISLERAILDTTGSARRSWAEKEKCGTQNNSTLPSSTAEVQVKKPLLGWHVRYVDMILMNPGY